MTQPGDRELTAREREVLTLAAQGYHDWQIGERLLVTPATVQTHLRLIRRAIGARKREDTAVWWARQLSAEERRRWQDSPAGQQFSNGLAQLSPAEVQVLGSLCDDPLISNDSLARPRGVNGGTVKKQIIGIMDKCCGKESPYRSRVALLFGAEIFGARLAERRAACTRD